MKGKLCSSRGSPKNNLDSHSRHSSSVTIMAVLHIIQYLLNLCSVFDFMYKHDCLLSRAKLQNCCHEEISWPTAERKF